MRCRAAGMGRLICADNIFEEDFMDEKKLPDNVSPERREFLEKITKGAFVVPAVLSVMMLNQKLNLTTANAISNISTD